MILMVGSQTQQESSTVIISDAGCNRIMTSDKSGERPTPLPTATWTPLPPAAAADAPGIANVQAEAVEVVQAVPRRGFLFVAIVGFGSAGLLGAAWVWLRKIT